MKTLLVVSDFHCGHAVGLTPPAHNPRKETDVLSEYRDALYTWFLREVKALGKIDLCVFNGDAIDGDGRKSGGTELITIDPQAQAQMAIDALKSIGAKKYLMTYGTPYHTGETTDYEDIVARDIGCDIGSTQDVEVEGVTFNFKHKVGGSQIPHGRATAIMREKLWVDMWAMRGEFPQAQVVVRSHVHYHVYAGTNDYLAMVTPALQGYGSKYGTRQVSGTVDFGFVVFQVDSKGRMSWRAPILRMDYQAPIKV